MAAYRETFSTKPLTKCIYIDVFSWHFMTHYLQQSLADAMYNALSSDYPALFRSDGAGCTLQGRDGTSIWFPFQFDRQRIVFSGAGAVVGSLGDSAIRMGLARCSFRVVGVEVLEGRLGYACEVDRLATPDHNYAVKPTDFRTKKL